MAAEPAKDGNRRRFVVNGWFLIIVLIAAIIVPTVLFWSYQRTQQHARWQQQLSLGQSFDFFGMEVVAEIVNGTSYPSNQTAQTWAALSLNAASVDLLVLKALDSNHFNQVARIQQLIIDLYSEWSCYTIHLNPSQRGTLSALLNVLGDKVLNAYGNYLNYTSSDSSSGPPFWYNGPTPPDEALLQQAVGLIVDWKGLPSLACVS